MNDLLSARQALQGHTLALCKDGHIITDDQHGIAPMLSLIGKGENLAGYSAADLVVGKAAAMLFVKAGIRALYAAVLSESAAEFLKEHAVAVQFGASTPQIINRAGTGPCPMEQTVRDISDPEEGYRLLKQKVHSLQKA